jgi:hypothetical protein
LAITESTLDCAPNIGSPSTANKVVDLCTAALDVLMFAAIKPTEMGTIDWEVIIELALF